MWGCCYGFPYGANRLWVPGQGQAPLRCWSFAFGSIRLLCRRRVRCPLFERASPVPARSTDCSSVQGALLIKLINTCSRELSKPMLEGQCHGCLHKLAGGHLVIDSPASKRLGGTARVTARQWLQGGPKPSSNLGKLCLSLAGGAGGGRARCIPRQVCIAALCLLLCINLGPFCNRQPLPRGATGSNLWQGLHSRCGWQGALPMPRCSWILRRTQPMLDPSRFGCCRAARANAAAWIREPAAFWAACGCGPGDAADGSGAAVWVRR